jgi:hypothetical protein
MELGSLDDIFPLHGASPLDPGLSSAIIVIVATVTIAFVVYTLNEQRRESPVPFNVPIPDQCSPEWKGEELSDPNIKVLASDVVAPIAARILISRAGLRLKRYTMLLSCNGSPPWSG